MNDLSTNHPSPEKRAFNQPVSTLGKEVFWFIAWLERRVRTNSRVGATPFFEESLFPWTTDFKSEWREVLAEANAVLAQRKRLPAFQDISSDVGYISQDDQWKTFMLLGYGIRSEKNLQSCPATARSLQKIPGVRTAFFSILEPGKRLPPHRGPYNGVLRLHLGLVIPEQPEKCWLRVASEHRHWQPGEVLIFDDALNHEVHNDTNDIRIVLFVDFLRPCRWPINWLNRFVVFAARYSPLVQDARRNQENWERKFYKPDSP
ncbi:MAG: aspartyl/asparaginyl beta-hydroxylase domain-containing protein [Gammaproteobacteria bacterium]|nr:aspartyl/asparaginyl beta-hydroxylase domain-containing protein [Gammaproteobacteria bacterium]